MIADPEKLKHWLPVDLYIGGETQSFTFYMLVSGTKYFYDLGVVPTKEPFKNYTIKV